MPMDERTTLLDGEPIPYWSSQFWPMLTNVAYLPSTTFPVEMGANSKMPIGLNAVGPEYSATEPEPERTRPFCIHHRHICGAWGQVTCGRLTLRGC